MRPGGDAETVRCMPDASRRINLEIDGEGTPLHGRVAEADGPAAEFEGWLGLLSVLGVLLDDPPATGGAPPPGTSPH